MTTASGATVAQRRPLEHFQAEEQTLLLPAPTTPYDIPLWSDPKVGRDQLAAVDKALYSIPHSYVGQRIRARADAQIVRFYARGLLIKTHPRKAPGGQSIDASDYPVERSVYAMRNVDALRRQAEAAGELIGRYAAALLDSPLPRGGKIAWSDATPQPSHDDLPSDRPAVVKPLAPERYKVQFTVSRETYEKLRRVQDLMRHTVPNGDPAVIFDRALTELLALLEKNKLAVTARPRTARKPARQSRYIPAGVKRDVWRRDAGRCAFVGTQGRCNETGFLEFHHVQPFADGGETIGSNLELRCRAHNAYEAERHFGSLLVREDRVVWEEGLGPDRVLRLARTGSLGKLSGSAWCRQREVGESDLPRVCS